MIVSKPGRHLDVSDTLLDLVKPYARRAEEAAEPLRIFMCVIPKVTDYCLADPSHTSSPEMHFRNMQSLTLQHALCTP